MNGRYLLQVTLLRQIGLDLHGKIYAVESEVIYQGKKQYITRKYKQIKELMGNTQTINADVEVIQ